MPRILVAHGTTMYVSHVIVTSLSVYMLYYDSIAIVISDDFGVCPQMNASGIVLLYIAYL